eukprot:1151493-Pelagomonas_calceolata.AAC.5
MRLAATDAALRLGPFFPLAVHKAWSSSSKASSLSFLYVGIPGPTLPWDLTQPSAALICCKILGMPGPAAACRASEQQTWWLRCMQMNSERNKRTGEEGMEGRLIDCRLAAVSLKREQRA